MTNTTLLRPEANRAIAGSLLFARGHSAKIIDAILMGLIIVRTGMPFLPIAVPTAQASLIVLLAVVAFRRPTRSLDRVRWYPLMATLLLMFLVVVSLMQDVDFFRRLFNIAVLMIVAGFLASGRIDVASGIKGIGVALTLNLILYYTGVAPDYYGGVLTGYLADKNAAGLVYGVGALLLLLTTQRTWQRILVFLAGGGALVLTDSRTSMAAYACAGIWLIVSPWLGAIFKIGLGLSLAFAFSWADANLSDIGEYEETRAGSDALRARIDAAADAKVAVSPWYGSGLGEANTEVEGATWLFHNAYDGLLVEGGFVALICVVAAYVLVGFGFFNRNAPSYAVNAVGAATMFFLLAATRLGEVFFAPIGFILLGVGLSLITEHDRFELDPRFHSDVKMRR